MNARLEPLEARRLLAAVGPVQDVGAALDRLDASPAVESAWRRAADLSAYDAAELASDGWVAVLPAGVTVDGLGVRLGAAATASPAPVLAGVARVDFAGDFAGDRAALLAAAGVPAGGMYPLVQSEATTRYVPSDTFFLQQWHLRNTGQGGGTAGADANVTAAWDRLTAAGGRVDGTGVTIGIVDDGLWGQHPDLAPNYDAASSYDFVGGDPNPSAGDHGTSVAGVAAARGDNSLGVTGVAFDARLAGLRLLGSGQNDATEAAALTYAPGSVDVYNNSWGPFDDGERFEAPGPLATAAIEQAATLGRGGLGAVHVWAGGNGGPDDDANRDGYASSRYTIGVAAHSNFGTQSGYSEDGASLLVSAPSNGGSLGITTTSPYNNFGYTNSFGGTSSAAPLVSGVIALMLEANPALTYRDVQAILVDTARPRRAGRRSGVGPRTPPGGR